MLLSSAYFAPALPAGASITKPSTGTKTHSSSPVLIYPAAWSPTNSTEAGIKIDFRLCSLAKAMEDISVTLQVFPFDSVTSEGIVALAPRLPNEYSIIASDEFGSIRRYLMPSISVTAYASSGSYTLSTSDTENDPVLISYSPPCR